jgi:hypothetical protein
MIITDVKVKKVDIGKVHYQALVDIYFTDAYGDRVFRFCIPIKTHNTPEGVLGVFESATHDFRAALCDPDIISKNVHMFGNNTEGI